MRDVATPIIHTQRTIRESSDSDSEDDVSVWDERRENQIAVTYPIKRTLVVQVTPDLSEEPDSRRRLMFRLSIAKFPIIKG